MAKVEKGLNKVASVGSLGTFDMAKDLYSGPDMPKVEDPKVAPDVDDKAAKRNKEREAQRKYAGKGRASTVLSGSSTLG